MIIEFPREGDIPLGESNDNRGDFDNKTDEELLALRARYKKFEESIFAESWQRPSLRRFQETCAALCLALDLATKEKDKDMVYCPWLFEAFNTLQSRIIKVPKVLPQGGAYLKWAAEIQEIVEGTCAAFGCFGDYLVRYVTAVYPEGTDSPRDFIKVVRSELNIFFKIGDSKNKDPFVTAAFELLYGYDKRGYPKLKKEVLGKLIQACPTSGWPGKIRTEEDMPAIIPNITNDEICSLFGIKLPPQEEREKIDRQIEAERAQVDLEAAFEKAEKFFASEDWFKHPGLAIAMWRICRRASAIGKKANDYHEYYYNKSSEGPVQPLSEDIRGDRQDDLVPQIKAFAFAFRREMADITSLSYKLEELIPSMWNLNGAIESLLYFLDKLPHDRHLNAARRLFGEWYELLSCIIREQIKPSAASSVMVDKIDEFCTELIAASDVLNERESVLHDKRAFQEVSPAPQYSFEVEKMFKEDKDINYVAYLERVMSICREVYMKLGEDTDKWPRQMLPYEATMQLLLAINASEQLKERLAGHDVPRSEFPPLHAMLDPEGGPFLSAMKRICISFPSLTEEEYTEALYEQLFSVGYMAEFYFSLSTTEQGVRVLPDWKHFWFTTYTELFCSQKTKRKPNVTADQVMGAYKELEDCCRILSREASIQNSNLMRKLSSEGKLPPGNVSFGCADAKNMAVLHDGMIPALAERVAEEIKKNPIDARVIGFDAKAKREITLATRVQMPERTYFSDPNLAALFEVHPNSIANWRKGDGTPEGFRDAFEKKDYEAMRKCAGRYKANRSRTDAMCTKRVAHGISEEQIYKQGGNPYCENCESSQ